ncbi:MAG: FAD binding domain-containing protein [Actinomycetota bacterium]|nr:FAD binding domain-containing protein [Actinomycetota bacterium]
MTATDLRPEPHPELRAEFRAAGTELTERRRSGVSVGAVHDIGRRPELARIDWDDDGAAILGALVTIDRIAEDARIRDSYPGLTAAAGDLATPQIRRMATLGGNLLQHTRCWYYRHPATTCLRKGGSTCPARTGNHRYGVVFDLGPCIAPHPSTLGAALLAYDAVVSTDQRADLPVAEVFGTGTDATRHHCLEPGELLTAVRLPPPVGDERAAYRRVISRARGEWPLVEALARLLVADGVVVSAAVTVGGVAPVPLRLSAVEAALLGAPPDAHRIAAASTLAAQGATALPMTEYKIPLLVATVHDVLEHAARS